MGSAANTMLRVLMTASAFAVALSCGCAATMQDATVNGDACRVDDADNDVVAVAGSGVGMRRFDSRPVITDRRVEVLPPDYVRTTASCVLKQRRPQHVFNFVPRRLSCQQAWDIATTVGKESGIDPGILFGIMRVESTLAVNAMSYVGAVGLMQVMPGPADKLGCGDRLDPLDNARCGVQILARFLKRYNNDLILGLSAYNAGFGMPNCAKRNNRIPANFSYPENVLRVRARFLRWGCSSWD